MARALVIFVSVAVALSVLGAAYLYKKPADSKPTAIVPFDWEYIRQVSLKEGSARAYEEFAREAAGRSPSAQHVAAHIFGKALYNAEGVGAVAVCDDRFLFGCVHAVLIAAVGDKGLGAIGELQTVCTTVRANFRVHCEHGIGHGIVGVLGYEDDKIVQSLDLCDTHLPKSNPINGCKGGVFMENVLRLAHDGTTHPRAFDETKKWGPCDSLDAKSLDGCAFWQPMWWVSSISIPEDVEGFAKEMGAWCTAAPGGASAEGFCIAGIGNVMHALIGTETERTARICATVTEDPGYRYRCHELAARRYLYSVPTEVALRACDGLHPEISAECRTNALQAVENADLAQ